MKVLLFAVMFSSLLFGQYYFLPESNSKVIEVEELKGKSIEFFRFARNEIFARHGYIFKDSDLNTFFNKMEWYKPNSNVELNMNEFEKRNVELLKLLEDSTEYGDYEILYKYDFNGYPLFYVGMDQYKNYKTTEWKSGGFILLEKKNNWLLDLKMIPPEYLIKNTINKPIVVKNYLRCLKNEQIKIEDFDYGYEGNFGDEIVVKRFVPSDFFELVYLGFDKENKFVKLFSIPSENYDREKINNSKILITIGIITNLHGTSSFLQEYLYDTIERELYQVPNVFLNLKREWQYTSTKDIPVFYDARSAALKTKLGQIDVMKKDTKVTFIKFYRVEEKGSVQVKFRQKNTQIEGWIPQEYSNSNYFIGMSSAG